MTLYKFLQKDGTGEYSGFKWSLPKKNGDSWIPGEWMPPVEKLEMCKSGYHGCEKKDLVRWINHDLYEMEWRGEKIDGEDKSVVPEARLVRKIETWNDRTARLFACACAREVLPIFEAEYPDDKRPRECIEVAERYANGEASKAELDAAGAAAWDAGAAAWDAWDAWAAGSARFARAAGAAGAAGSARFARAAGNAGAAAWSARSAWAAGNAGATAWDAWAAGATAGATAWAARAAGNAGAAAWSARSTRAARTAGAAAEEWQSAKLVELIFEEEPE